MATVEEVAAEARALREQGIGGPCPHCGKAQDKLPDGPRYSSGSHSAAVEAAFTGVVICCAHCEEPLGRRIGFLSCPTHGWECDSRTGLTKDTRKRVSIETEVV